MKMDLIDWLVGRIDFWNPTPISIDKEYKLDDSGDINYHVCSIAPTTIEILESPVMEGVKFDVSTIPDTAWGGE